MGKTTLVVFLRCRYAIDYMHLVALDICSCSFLVNDGHRLILQAHKAYDVLLSKEINKTTLEVLLREACHAKCGVRTYTYTDLRNIVYQIRPATRPQSAVPRNSFDLTLRVLRRCHV